jgi:solute carrier family 13 (sodium-dependent dicarboxylate transporter), member 2/3/5
MDASTSPVNTMPGSSEIEKPPVDLKRLFFIFLGLTLFCGVYFSPEWGPAVDPKGEAFPLSREGKAALALFLLTATWWVFEVIPIGVTSIMVGVVQVLFVIREPRTVFTDFLDPSVWFIFGSLAIGMAFTKTGLTRRLAYSMLTMVGERTSMIYLGCFVLTSGLTLIMAHTAVAATVFPLFLAINALYSDEDKPTKFGKGLFMGMAFVAGAGSIITLLGAARGAVALGFFRDITGRSIGFFELTKYMWPVGVVMTFLLWAFFMVVYKPEKKTIPGLRERSKRLKERLGPITRNEILALTFVLTAISLLGLRSFFPELEFMHKSAIILSTTVLFFLFGILKLDDLEDTSWNIILLFGGAMCMGFCLWDTGAAKWLAVQWLVIFETAPAFVFIMAIAFFVLIMTNLIMNVAAIAISLPVALVLAPYVGVSEDVILYCSLVPAGMPFLLLVGAAPNAIAYGSGQFSSKEFFLVGIPASIMLMIILALFVWLIWPMMGMPIYAT